MTDLVKIMICAVLFNHLGLAEALAVRLLKRESFLPFTCCKCLTFWCCLPYSIVSIHYGFPDAVLASFLMAWAALWTELFFGFLSTKYEKLWQDIFPPEESFTNQSPKRDAKPVDNDGL